MQQAYQSIKNRKKQPVLIDKDPVLWNAPTIIREKDTQKLWFLINRYPDNILEKCSVFQMGNGVDPQKVCDIAFHGAENKGHISDFVKPLLPKKLLDFYETYLKILGKETIHNTGSMNLLGRLKTEFSENLLNIVFRPWIEFADVPPLQKMTVEKGLKKYAKIGRYERNLYKKMYKKMKGAIIELQQSLEKQLKLKSFDAFQKAQKMIHSTFYKAFLF